MIGKSLVGFVVLCSTYMLLMHAFPGLTVSQNQNQTNYIKAEQYLYASDVAKPVVIVGTSLSARLVADSLPGAYNLAFGGMSVTDGLAIVERSSQKPRLLLIEINLFYKTGSARFLEPLFNPVNYQLKKYFVSLRSDKQPIALATAALIRVLKNAKGHRGQSSGRKAEKDPPFQQQVFSNYLTQYNILPDTTAVTGSLKMLKTAVVALQREGIKIVFLEMPVNEGLIRSPRHQYLSHAFRAAFPSSLYTYVPNQKWNFRTTDGLHMNRMEAQKFTKYLRTWYQQTYPNSLTKL